MAVKRISGNQIADSTQAIITTLSFLNTNSVFRLPSGTTGQRPTGVSLGTLRFNTSLDSAEVYKADADGQGNPGWTSVGGGGSAAYWHSPPPNNIGKSGGSGGGAGPFSGSAVLTTRAAGTANQGYDGGGCNGYADPYMLSLIHIYEPTRPY